MSKNKKTSFKLASKDKTESNARVFARLVSRSETKKVSGAQKCTGSEPVNGTPRIDCVYES